MFTLEIKVSNNVKLVVENEPTCIADEEGMWEYFEDLMEKYGGIDGVANRSRLH